MILTIVYINLILVMYTKVAINIKKYLLKYTQVEYIIKY